ARSLVKGYFQMENPQGFDAHEVEEFVEATLPNGVPVRGFIDRVDVAANGQVRVVDYKTGKKPPPRFAAQALFQMKFYALVYWRLHDLIPAQLRLMYLKVADDLVLQPTPAELQYFERDLRELWDSILADIHSGDFQPKTSKLCDWCSFQELCPAFGGTPPEYPGVCYRLLVAATPVHRVEQVLRAQHLVESVLVEHLLFQDELAHGLSGRRGLLADEVTVVVADQRVEVGDDADRVL